MAKTITKQQLIGSQGEAFVKERANAIGFLFSPYGPPEAGIDGMMELRDPVTGHVNGKLLAVQVRTTEGNYSNDDGKSFDYLMDAHEVDYWRGCSLPVIIVLLHLGRREAFWKSVDLGSGPDARRLRIDREKDAFDSSARDALADLCVSKSGFGVWFPPLKGGETGHLNFVEVVLPARMYLAASPFKTGRQALAELLEHEARPPDDWTIRNGQFRSFQNPASGPLARIVDVGSIEEIATDEIALSDDQDEEHVFIELLRRTLGRQLDGLLIFKRDQKAFYFPATPETIERVYPYMSLKQRTSADVVKKYENDGKLKYVRHHAFEPRFWRIGSQWLLSVTPTFVFTWDGVRPDKFASGRLAGKKQREFNSSVLGQFLMWRYLLTTLGQSADDGLFAVDSDVQYALRFQAIETLELPRGVPDELWRATEPEPIDETQMRMLV